MASVWFEGADDLNRLAGDLTKAGVIASTRGPQIVRKTAADITRDAQQIVPVDTGNLKNGIGWEMTGVFSAEVGPTAEYAIFPEYGTSTQAPQPYMGPATDRNAPAFYAAVDKLGGEALEGG